MNSTDPAAEAPRCVWTTLVTNTKYLEGVLTLNFSLKRSGSKYPLVALVTKNLELGVIELLAKQGIVSLPVEFLLPSVHRDYSNDTRFYDCWSKLQPFSLTQYDRVCQLDSDMVVTQNMDELMDIPLDVETAPFAASHACVCNPYNKPHYPADWIPENCVYSHYTSGPEPWRGPPCTDGLAICNGGLQVVIPSEKSYQKIIDALNDPGSTTNYDFADQSLLSDVFRGKWVPLSYKYNALKTLKLFHSDIWDDSEVKNIHYIINPKPWDTTEEDDTRTFGIWHNMNAERLKAESAAADAA